MGHTSSLSFRKHGGTPDSRGSGPLIPRLLKALVTAPVPRDVGGDGTLRLCDLDQPFVAALDRRQRGRLRSLVARAVQDHLHRLPPGVLEHVVPPPSVVLRDVPIEDRTRRCLMGSFPHSPTSGSWTVHRYLKVSRFKASCLVDLLSSLEAIETRTSASVDGFRRPQAELASSLGPAAEASVQDRPIKEMMAAFTRRLPLTESAAEVLLADVGFRGANDSLAGLLDLAQSRGWVLPFRRVRHGGVTMLVAPGDAPGVSACYTAAVRSMQSWGMASVRQIVRHVRVLHRHAIDSRIARAVLSSVPKFSWLDQKSGWFWFLDRPNRLVRALGKLFSVAPRINLDDLLKAILRSYGFRHRPGRRVIQNACAQVPGYQIDGDWVRLQRPLDRDEWLSPTELSLVEMLEQTNGSASLSSLSRMAQSWGISVPTLRLAIHRSPVVRMARGNLVLVGSSMSLG